MTRAVRTQRRRGAAADSAATPRRATKPIRGRGDTDRDQVLRVDPLVGERDAAGVDDRIAERDRPHVLEQDDRRGGSVRDRVRDVPGLLVGDQVAVRHRLGAELGAGLDALVLALP